jgi:hypothetical protein
MKKVVDFYKKMTVALNKIESIMTDYEKERFKTSDIELVEYQHLYAIYDYVILRNEFGRASEIYKVIRDLTPMNEYDPEKQRKRLKCNKCNYEFLSYDDFISCPKCSHKEPEDFSSYDGLY